MPKQQQPNGTPGQKLPALSVRHLDGEFPTPLPIIYF
jgi:hypothetical protein